MGFQSGMEYKWWDWLLQSAINGERNSQVKGINYDKTFVLVARYSSIWVLLGIGVMLDFEIHQMVVKSTFLHCGLKECFYMVQSKMYKEHD
jgi:hypothetical protein